MSMTMTVWTLYHSPSDHPGMWVIRPSEVSKGSVKPGKIAFLGSDRERAEAFMKPKGLVWLDRKEGDAPSIVGTWA